MYTSPSYYIHTNVRTVHAYCTVLPYKFVVLCRKMFYGIEARARLLASRFGLPNSTKPQVDTRSHCGILTVILYSILLYYILLYYALYSAYSNLPTVLRTSYYSMYSNSRDESTVDTVDATAGGVHYISSSGTSPKCLNTADMRHGKSLHLPLRTLHNVLLGHNSMFHTRALAADIGSPSSPVGEHPPHLLPPVQICAGCDL